jgi:hypothetical protein
MRSPAYEDTGTLTVEKGMLRFQGKSRDLTITDISRLSYGLRGADLNTWVDVEYRTQGRNKRALFKDGRYLGWPGMFGATKRCSK